MIDKQELGHKITYEVEWAVKERQGGLWVPVLKRYNLLTNYGLTALATAPGGAYAAPIYMVIEQSYTTLVSSYGPGATSIQTNADPTLTGDTQLVLGAGLGSQETVTFSAKSGSGPYTFTLTAGTVNSHTATDPICRAVTVSDTMASVLSEASYDPVFATGKRSAITANYSPGVGQNTMQFFFAGITATNIFFAHVGLSETASIGQGNLHNYAVLGYNHNSTNDVEIDVTWVFSAT